MLSACGSDVNAVNKAGDTALHSAASMRYDTVVQFLAEKGADLNVKNKRGQTPLAAIAGGGRGRAVADGRRVRNSDSPESTAALLRKLGAVE